MLQESLPKRLSNTRGHRLWRVEQPPLEVRRSPDLARSGRRHVGGAEPRDCPHRTSLGRNDSKIAAHPAKHPCRPSASIRSQVAGRLDDPGGKDVSPKIPRVEVGVEDRLVDRLQLPEGERAGKELRRNWRVRALGSETVARKVHRMQRVVVKTREIVVVKPTHLDTCM